MVMTHKRPETMYKFTKVRKLYKAIQKKLLRISRKMTILIIFLNPF